MMEKILRRFAIHIYFPMRSWWPVWFYVLNAKNRRLYETHRPQLDEVQQRIVNDLLRDGIAVAHLDELFPGKNLLEQFRREVENLKANAAAKTRKEFLRQLWDDPMIAESHDPFVKFSLEQKVLDIVNRYMGMCTYLYYLTLNITMPVPPGSEAVQSQRWHRDPEDKKLCKIFVYMNDVDEGAGPFMYARGTEVGGKFGNLFPQRPPRGIYPPAEAVERLIPREQMLTATGRAGTVVFADTAGIHRGGYATKSERIMFTGGYCSSAPPWPLRFKFASSIMAKTRDNAFPPVSRHALLYSPGQFSLRLLKTIKKNVDAMM